MYTFNWPGNGRTPNFNLPNAPRSFIFTTSNFSFPNIPGGFHEIQSKHFNFSECLCYSYKFVFTSFEKFT